MPDIGSTCHPSVDSVSWVHFDYGFRVRFMKAPLPIQTLLAT